MNLRVLLHFLIFFVIIHSLLLGYFISKHELVHKHVAEYFGYETGDIIFHSGGISTVSYVPAGDLDDPRYWAYMAAQSSVDAVGYHVLTILPFFSSALEGIATLLYEQMTAA